MSVLQGSVAWKQEKCAETPFSLNARGVICYHDQEFLVRTRTRFGFTSEVPFEGELGFMIVDALNKAYRAGYEKDRGKWVSE